MDIQSRKIEFIQEFLKIDSEESESDFKNEKYKPSSELLSKSLETNNN
jgi:hypothetical protein